MLGLTEQVVGRLRSIAEPLREFISDELGLCLRDTTGSVLIEYALYASGIGVSVGGAVAALGIDVGSLFMALDTPLCQHLALRVDCWKP